MKILFLTNNKITMSLIEWLKEREDVIVYSEKLNLLFVESLNPDMIISYNYKYLIKEDVINLHEIINLHISLLPWNRGADPNLWSFIENSLKGVTIHYIDTGIDTGSVLLQEAVDFDDEVETLGSSYATLHEKIQQLFKDNWENIKNSRIIPMLQPKDPTGGAGNFHYKEESMKIKEVLGEQIWSLPVLEVRRRAEEMVE